MLKSLIMWKPDMSVLCNALDRTDVLSATFILAPEDPDDLHYGIDTIADCEAKHAALDTAIGVYHLIRDIGLCQELLTANHGNALYGEIMKTTTERYKLFTPNLNRRTARGFSQEDWDDYNQLLNTYSAEDLAEARQAIVIDRFSYLRQGKRTRLGASYVRMVKQIINGEAPTGYPTPIEIDTFMAKIVDWLHSWTKIDKHRLMNERIDVIGEILENPEQPLLNMTILKAHANYRIEKKLLRGIRSRKLAKLGYYCAMMPGNWWQYWDRNGEVADQDAWPFTQYPLHSDVLEDYYMDCCRLSPTQKPLDMPQLNTVREAAITKGYRPERKRAK